MKRSNENGVVGTARGNGYVADVCVDRLLADAKGEYVHPRAGKFPVDGAVFRSLIEAEDWAWWARDNWGASVHLWRCGAGRLMRYVVSDVEFVAPEGGGEFLATFGNDGESAYSLIGAAVLGRRRA